MIDFDVSKWFADSLALSFAVASIMALVRKHLWQIDGKFVIFASALLGMALAVFGMVSGFLAMDWFSAVGFGLYAGVQASAGVDVIRSMQRDREANHEVNSKPPPPNR